MRDVFILSPFSILLNRMMVLSPVVPKTPLDHGVSSGVPEMQIRQLLRPTVVASVPPIGMGSLVALFAPHLTSSIIISLS